MSLEFDILEEQVYTLDAFSITCNELLSDQNRLGDFVRFALTGGNYDPDGINTHQAVIDPIQNILDDNHLVDVVRDYDSLLGLTRHIAFNSAITVYPAAKFEDTLSKNIHIKVNLVGDDGVSRVLFEH